MKQPVSSLRQWMLEQYAPQFHLEKKTLLKQLDQVGFYAERCLPPVGQRVSCIAPASAYMWLNSTSG